jgi:hypothetical protein
MKKSVLTCRQTDLQHSQGIEVTSVWYTKHIFTYRWDAPTSHLSREIIMIEAFVVIPSPPSQLTELYFEIKSLVLSSTSFQFIIRDHPTIEHRIV